MAVCAMAVTVLAACAGGFGSMQAPSASPIESQLLAEIALERGNYSTAVSQYLNVALLSRDPEHARRATELAYDYGFDAFALAAARRWVKLEPASELAHGYLGRLYTRYNKPDKAWDSLAIALGPVAERQDEDYALLSADLASSPRQALALFQRFNTEFPETPGVLRSLAELAAQNGDIAMAASAAQQTIALRPDWSTTRVWFAHLLLVNGEMSRAFEQMAFALESNPGIDFELEFVSLLAASNQLQNAADRLERLSDRYPDSLGVALLGAAVLNQAGQTEQATKIYQQLLASGKCRSECDWQLGAMALRQGDYAGAIESLGQVTAIDRLQPAKLAIAQAWLAQNEVDKALEVLAGFAADYPKRAFPMLQPRATVLAAAGRYAEAVETMRLALEYRPWSESLWLVLGGMHESDGKPDEALRAFRKAWELAPDVATTQNAYGYTLVTTTRQYAKAHKLIAQALEQEPANPAIMDSMGWVLFKQHKRAEARAWLERAYKMQPDPEIAAHLGEVLW